MRLAKITTYYKGFFESFYSSNSYLLEKSYAEHHDILTSQYTGNAYFSFKDIIDLGFKATEFVFNASELQKQWATEYNQQYSLYRTLIAQIADYKPNVVFIQDSVKIPADVIAGIRAVLPGKGLIIGNCCTPYSKGHLELFSLYDFFIVCSQQFKLNYPP